MPNSKSFQVSGLYKEFCFGEGCLSIQNHLHNIIETQSENTRTTPNIQRALGFPIFPLKPMLKKLFNSLTCIFNRFK